MSISKERKEYLLEKFKYAAKEFGKSGTKSNHLAVPKEQQLSIDLGNRKVFGIINRILYWIESNFTYFFHAIIYFQKLELKEEKFLELIQGLSILLQMTRQNILKFLIKENYTWT